MTRRIRLRRYEKGQLLKSQDLNEDNKIIEDAINELLASLPDMPHRRPSFSPKSIPLIGSASPHGAPGAPMTTALTFQIHLLEGDKIVRELKPGEDCHVYIR